MKKNNGITLIALVITIIVMLILVAVTITMAVNGGLFSYAGKATNDTKIKMQEELELSNVVEDGNYEDLIAKYTGNSEKLNPKGKIPDGATYTIASTNEELSEGDDFPSIIEDGDTYEFGDYEYKYNYYMNQTYKLDWSSSHSLNGWGVRVTDTTKNKYENVLNSINEMPIKSLDYTFAGCTNMIESPVIPKNTISIANTFKGCSKLKEAPVIPRGVENMIQTFSSCKELSVAPSIPDTVTSMGQTFWYCEALTTAPVIPESVKVLTETFLMCTSLRGNIIINSNPSSYSQFLYGTTYPITLNGRSSRLAELAATANNGNVQVASN